MASTSLSFGLAGRCQEAGGNIRLDVIRRVANDHMAFAVLDIVRHQSGLRLPEDVSVVACDDEPLIVKGSARIPVDYRTDS